MKQEYIQSTEAVLQELGVTAEGLTAAVLEVPFLANAFDFTPIGITEYLIALGLGVLVNPVVEIDKFFKNHRKFLVALLRRRNYNDKQKEQNAPAVYFYRNWRRKDDQDNQSMGGTKSRCGSVDPGGRIICDRQQRDHCL